LSGDRQIDKELVAIAIKKWMKIQANSKFIKKLEKQ
jgi:hypothetical protein